MAKPKLALIPATQGSKLYSVLPADGVGDFTFSRGGTTGTSATRINKDGLIETVASGVSRLNYPLIDGVVNGCPSHLLEPSRLQLIPYSEDFENSDWTKNAGTTITNNYATSPDGTLNASRYLGTGASGLGDKFTLSSASYTLSFYVKSNTSENQFCALLGDSSQSSGDLLVTTEWKRISHTFTGSGLSNKTNGIFRDSSNNDIDILIYGAQLEQGSYPTSYIPNYGTSAGITRVAETATGAGDASTFNDSEGVLMVEASALANATNKYINIYQDANNRILLWITSTGVIRGYAIVNSSGSDVFIDAVGVDATNNNKIALSWQGFTLSLFVNGVKIGDSTVTNSFSIMGLTTLDLKDVTNANHFYGNTKQIQYFDSALNDSDLETLTSWTSFTDLANGQLYSIK